MYTGPGGGLYTGPSGGMYTGADSEPYMSNIPPWHFFVEYLREHGREQAADRIMQYLK